MLGFFTETFTPGLLHQPQLDRLWSDGQAVGPPAEPEIGDRPEHSVARAAGRGVELAVGKDNPLASLGVDPLQLLLHVLHRTWPRRSTLAGALHAVAAAKSAPAAGAHGKRLVAG